MNRRAFTQSMARTVAGAFGLAHTSLPGFAKTSGNHTDEAPDAPFKLSVMLWTVFNDLPFEQRLEKIAEAGYRNVEMVGEYEKWSDADFNRVIGKRKELGITFDCTAGLKHGVSNPGDRQALLTELRRALTIMERIECPSMILLSGNRVPSISREAQHQSCIDTLKEAASVVEEKRINGEPVRLLLETIDPEENPKYYLTSIAEALEIVEAVNHPQVQLLY